MKRLLLKFSWNNDVECCRQVEISETNLLLNLTQTLKVLSTCFCFSFDIAWTQGCWSGSGYFGRIRNRTLKKFGSRSRFGWQVGSESGFCLNTKIQQPKKITLHFDFNAIFYGSDPDLVTLPVGSRVFSTRIRNSGWDHEHDSSIKESLNLCMTRSFFLHRDSFAHLRFCELSRTLVMPPFTCF